MTDRVKQIIFYLLIFSLALKRCLQPADPDLGWHLKAAEDLIFGGRWLMDQTHLWTLGHLNWVNHEWLIDTISWGLWRIGGYWLLAVVFAALISLIFILANHGKRLTFWRVSLTLTALLAAYPHLGVRPQIISALALAMLLLIIKESRRYRWLPVLFWLWSSMHAGFLFGLIVLCAKTFWDLTAAWRDGTWRQRWWTISRWPLAAWLATWLTPYFHHLYTFLFAYRQADLSGYINEWRPLYEPPINPWQIILPGLIAATWLFNHFSKKRTPIFQQLVLGLLMFMSFTSIRHSLLLGVGALSLLAEPIDQTLPQIKRQAQYWLAIIAGLLILHTWLLIDWRIDPFNGQCRKWPCQTADYIAAHPELLSRRWLNHYNLGGWLIWRWPEAKLYADGRLPQIRYQGQPLIVDFYEFLNHQTAGAKLATSSIDLVWWLKRPAASAEPLLEYLRRSPDWTLAAEDATSVIYLKK